MKRILAIVLPILAIAVVVGAGLYLKSRSSKSADSVKPGSVNLDNNQTTATNQETKNLGGLQITDEKVGDGAEAKTGNTVSVNYLGTLTDGTKFDSSYDRNQPFSFALGGGQVIKGWDQGVVGMKIGGKRKLVIPPELAYGSQSPSSSIPPNSTLVFEIELLSVQ